MNYTMEKVLANSDVEYWRKMPKGVSHQSAIYIGTAQSEDVCGILGEAKTDEQIRIALCRSNLIHVLTAHFEGNDVFYSSRSLGQWSVTAEYIKKSLDKIFSVFRTEKELFIASINRQATAKHCRVWIKSLAPELRREDGECGISIFDFLFSGDTLRFVRDDNDLIHIDIIPNDIKQQMNVASESGLPRADVAFSGKDDGRENFHAYLNEPPTSIDRLSVALKFFTEHRSDDGQSGGKNYDECYADVRAEAARIDGDYLVSCDYEAFRNTLNAKQVANSFFSKHTDDDKRRLGDFIATVRQDPRDISFYLAPGNEPNVPGVGPAMLTAILTRTRPDLFVFFTEQMFESVKFLGLTAEEALPALSTDAYNTYKGIQTTIRDRMREMGIKAENGNDADYLTVNEFTWFVKVNLNRIEKGVQEDKMKLATHKSIDACQMNRKPKVDIKDSEDVLLLRLRAALRTKPFAILAGHSGTGKSRMVRKLAYMTCNDNALRYVLDDAGNIKKDEHGNDIFLKEPGNFCMVQVKPNWHDSSDLLGYYSELGKRYRSTDFVEFICKAYAYPNTPFFVCLDEMNLAPVEQYFAEYLSAIESRKLTSDGALTTDELIAKSAYTKEDATGKSVMYEWLGCTMTESQQWLETYGLTIPRNLFVVGTVNMDETTNQFSRKVLDRAMTIEMTDADFDSFGTKSPELKFDDEYMGDDAVKEMLSGEVQAKTLTTDQKDNLNALKTVLAPTSFAVAYRFANEYALYEESLKKTVDSSVKPNPPGTPEGTPEEALTLPKPAAAVPAVPETASSEAAGAASAGEAASAAEEGTAEGVAPAPAKKDPAIPSAFDDMVLMKVLPRISGDEADVKQIFYEGRVVGKKGTRENPADKTLMKILDVSKDTESLRKIAAILDRGGTYLSFWP